MQTLLPKESDWLQRPGWIFDCDGTLAASMWIHHRSWTHIISKQIGRPFDFPWPLFCSMGGMSAQDTCIKLKQLYGFDLNIDQLLADGHDFLEIHLEKDVTARTDVVNLLHYVRKLGHKTAVASAGRRTHVDKTLNKIHLHHLFDTIVTVEDAARSKPHPDLFLVAAQRLNLDPKDCVVIEDSPRGKEAADAAGMACILVSPA
jgi:HAD superfamily hydrolase (TIGR01509 family)